MKKSHMKPLFLLALLLFNFCFLFADSVHADFGPKPSTTIHFQNMPEEEFYACLLSDQVERNGPNSTQHPTGGQEYPQIWDKFMNYSRPENAYFWGHIQKCSEQEPYAWTYYPPQRFYLLLYYPKSDSFQISPAPIEKKGFYSIYSLNMAGKTTDPNQASAPVFDRINSSKLVRIFPGFLFRLAVTCLLELLVALAFGFRASKQIGIILVTNLVTQLLLNLLSIGGDFSTFVQGYFIIFLCFEILIFLIEAGVYAKTLPKWDKDRAQGKKPHPVVYALTANLVSFLATFVVTVRIPGFN